jgi:hypothetical protein
LATIQPNNRYARGINSGVTLFGQELGPNLFQAVLASAIVNRATGYEGYQLGGDPDSFIAQTGSFAYPVGSDHPVSSGVYNSTWQAPSTSGFDPGGTHPFYDSAGSVLSWESRAASVRLENHLAKWMYQPSLPSPDYGALMDCAAHDGHNTVGNVLHCQYYGNGPWTRNFNLSPYLVAGQKIIKYYGHWYDVKVATLPAGTVSDTVNGDANTFVAYVFPTNEASELVQPTVAVHQPITDEIPNAARVIARCAYSEWLLDHAPALIFDLGSGSGTLGVDPSLAQSYCRLQYLDTNGKVISTGDVQNF